MMVATAPSAPLSPRVHHTRPSCAATRLLFLPVAFLFASVAHASRPLAHAECFDALPGDTETPRNTPGRARIVELMISDGGRKAYVATEYTGKGNFMISVYVRRHARYCLVGDLGTAFSVEPSRRDRNAGYYGLILDPESGSDYVRRTFTYRSGTYQLASCEVSAVDTPPRTCTWNER